MPRRHRGWWAYGRHRAVLPVVPKTDGVTGEIVWVRHSESYGWKYGVQWDEGYWRTVAEFSEKELMDATFGGG
jgi:hypothetical protein